MLQPGIYEQVVNKEIERELSGVPEVCKSVSSIDPAEAAKVLSQYLTNVIQKGLENVNDNGGGIEAQIRLVNNIVSAVQQSTREDEFALQCLDKSADQLFALLREDDARLAAGKTAKDIQRPETSIAQSSLFTGAVHEPQMYTELKKEIESADRIDMLVSFIKWSGLRLILMALIPRKSYRCHEKVRATQYALDVALCAPLGTDGIVVIWGVMIENIIGSCYNVKRPYDRLWVKWR